MPDKRTNEFIKEALAIIKHAKERKATLRVMGAVAIRIHCPKFFHLLDAFKRELSDLDFMSYSQQRQKVVETLKELNYEQDRSVEFLYGGERQIFYNKKKNFMVDVFFDTLNMSHTINFTKRLEIDDPTISLADIVLEKLQIVKINEKDIKDLIVLLREHDVGGSENETINMNYIAQLLSDDWGFYYTVTTNLKKIRDKFLPRYKILQKEDISDVKFKIDKLLKAIEEKDKSFKWKVRAKIGTRKKWYHDVEEVVR